MVVLVLMSHVCMYVCEVVDRMTEESAVVEVWWKMKGKEYLLNFEFVAHLFFCLRRHQLEWKRIV